MAKITPSHLFSSISGKLCSKQSTYIALNKKTGQMYSAEYHGGNQPNSEQQQEMKSIFTSKSKLAASWWNANKPSTENSKGTDSYQLVLKAYKSQNKIGNPYSYLRTLVTDELKVKLGDLDITGSVTTGSGSGTTSGGGTSSSGTGGSASGGSSSGGDSEEG